MSIANKIELIDTETDLIRQSETLVEYVFRDLEDVYESLSDKTIKDTQERIIRSFNGLHILSEKLGKMKEVLKSFDKLEVFHG